MTNPVLFLGLGGTGKDTLMQVRRLFLDAYSGGQMPADLIKRYGPARLPHTAFLCLDADDKMEDIDGRALDEFLSAARLTEGEFLNVELEPRRVAELYDHPERHPDHARWFDFSLEKTGIPKNGCGQTRPWGRLAFFQHYDRIRSQLAKLLSSLIAVDVATDAQKIGVQDLQNDVVQVYVIFSIAGGTGSGLFLDTAFLLQDLADELHIKANAEAIILLPEVFSNNPTDRIFANAYAALMEIEYYNLRREGAADLDNGPDAKGAEGVFPIYWPGRTTDGTIKTMRGPVFEPVWLIGNRSRGVNGQGNGTVVRNDHKSELTGMIAEWLALRTLPQLRIISADINMRASNYASVEMVRTARIPVFENGAHDATGEVELSCRYGSFGLSKVFAPVNVTRQMAGDHLVGDVVASWLTETGAAPSDDEMERDLRPRVLLRLNSDYRASRDEEALYNAVDSENQLAATGIVSKAISHFRDEVHPSIADDAGEQLAVTLRERFSDYQWLATSTQNTDAGLRGQYAERIATGARKVFARVRDGLDEIVSTALAEPARRFPFAEAAIKRLALEFDEVAKKAKSRAANSGAALNELVIDRDTLLTHAANTRSRFVLRRIAKVAIDIQAEIIEMELQTQIWSEVAAGAAATVGVIGAVGKDESGGTRSSMLSELAKLKGELRKLKDRMEARVSGLGARHESILNKQLRASNPSSYYFDRDGEPVGQAFIRAKEVELFGDDNVFDGTSNSSPWALRTRFLGSAGERLVEKLSIFGRGAMAHAGRETNVATILDNDASGGDDARYVDSIRQTVQSGTAWLATRSTGVEGQWRSVDNYTVATALDGSGVERLRSTFARSFSEAGARLRDGPRDTVYFEQELAAFPLSVLPGIQAYRDRAYLPALRSAPPVHSEAQGGGGGLHIELNIEKYVDLVEPTRDEATRRAEAIQLFVEALVKGRLHPHRDRFGLVHYSYMGLRGLQAQSRDIGRYDRAIRTLSDRASPEGIELRRQVEAVEVLWDEAPDKAGTTKARILAILDRYMNSPSESPVRGAEWDRNVGRLSARFVERWGADILKQARTERATLPSWGVASLPSSGHVTPPDLPEPALQ